MLQYRIALAISFALCLSGQAQSRDSLNRAYEHLRAGQLEQARTEFEAGLALEPGQVAARTDYAYLLLKMGETELGRDALKQVLEAKPDDERLGLEYAYLAYETGKRGEAFEIFMRLKLTGKDEAIRKQAGETAERLDQELKTSIARWREAAAKTPDSYSVHEELARLLEDHNEWVEAASEYRTAFSLKPDKRRFLLDIARVELQAVRPDYAHAALIAASRGGPAMIAEEAKELLPQRYPYVYEFELAVQMDPLNAPLRRELGFLLLKMNREKEAIAVFEGVLRLEPNDALVTAQLAFLRAPKAAPSPEEMAKNETGLTAVRDLAQTSFEKGYLKDALRYLLQLHETNPDDAATTLRLGWTYNMLKQDKDAVRCFDLARRSSDPKVASEADRAYRNLRPSLAPVRVTAWMLPFYSSRWSEIFAYGQLKAEFKVPQTTVRPYLSVRFIGDLGRNNGTAPGIAGQVAPGTLSERAVVFAAGLATPRKHGLMAWGEVGSSWQYFARQQNAATMMPDYRAGVNWVRSRGAASLSNEGGWFTTSTIDAVYLSRFDHNTLFYSQNRVGYHAPNVPVQFYLNLNLTGDVKRMDWANYYEFGPGIRWRLPALPPGVYFFADAVYGRQMLKGDGLRPRRYTDIRAGVWYAFTR